MARPGRARNARFGFMAVVGRAGARRVSRAASDDGAEAAAAVGIGLVVTAGAVVGGRRGVVATEVDGHGISFGSGGLICPLVAPASAGGIKDSVRGAIGSRGSDVHRGSSTCPLTGALGAAPAAGDLPVRRNVGATVSPVRAYRASSCGPMHGRRRRRSADEEDGVGAVLRCQGVAIGTRRLKRSSSTATSLKDGTVVGVGLGPTRTSLSGCPCTTVAAAVSSRGHAVDEVVLDRAPSSRVVRVAARDGDPRSKVAHGTVPVGRAGLGGFCATERPYGRRAAQGASSTAVRTVCHGRRSLRIGVPSDHSPFSFLGGAV